MQPRTSHHLALRLHDEWRHLRHTPDAIARANGWRIVTGHMDDLATVLTAVGFECAAGPGHEVAMRQLVLLARDDELAARIVVQRLLPGLLTAAGRRRQSREDDPAAELFAAAWIAIRTFNPRRRPACLAAALIRDADHIAFRQSQRRRSSSERPTDVLDEAPLPDRGDHPFIELARLVRAARHAGLAEPADLAFVKSYLDTPRTDDVARALGVSPRTVRNRRDRAARRLRAVAA